MAKRSRDSEPEETVEHEMVVTDPVLEVVKQMLGVLEKIEQHMAVDAELKQRMLATQQGPSRLPLVAGQQYPRSGDTYPQGPPSGPHKGPDPGQPPGPLPPPPKR